MTITSRALFAMFFAAPLAKLFGKKPTSSHTVVIYGRCRELIRDFQDVRIAQGPAHAIINVRVNGEPVPFEADLDSGTIRLL